MGKDGTDRSSPLLSWTAEDEQQSSYESASATSAVFSLSTSIVGAGIMSLPATMQISGVVPALIFIVFFAFFTNTSIDFLLKYSKAANVTTFGGVMGDAFGRSGRITLQVFLVVNVFGSIVSYLIIMADVLSGSTSGSVHHTGVLEEWAGSSTWWNQRKSVMLFTTMFILAPLISLRRIDSLRVSSAASVILAVFFVVATTAIAVWKLINGDIGWPKMFPDLEDGFVTIFKCFTAIPVIVASFVCHHCVHPILSELDKSCNPQTVVRTSLALCTAIYVATSFSGYLLFGDDTSSDILSNFDVDLGVPNSKLIADMVRVGYIIHLMFVFPLVFFVFRLNLDGLMFPKATALTLDTRRFYLLTACSMAVSLFGACFIPTIWVVSQLLGSTGVIVMCYVFPPSIALRDVHGISTRRERWAAWFMITVAAASSGMALTANLLEII